MSSLKLYEHFINSLKDTLSLLFSSDMKVISDEAKKNFSNPYDSREFSNAIIELRKLEKKGEDARVTLKLKNDKEITLTR